MLLSMSTAFSAPGEPSALVPARRAQAQAIEDAGEGLLLGVREFGAERPTAVRTGGVPAVVFGDPLSPASESLRASALLDGLLGGRSAVVIDHAPGRMRALERASDGLGLAPRAGLPGALLVPAGMGSALRLLSERTSLPLLEVDPVACLPREGQEAPAAALTLAAALLLPEPRWPSRAEAEVALASHLLVVSSLPALYEHLKRCEPSPKLARWFGALVERLSALMSTSPLERRANLYSGAGASSAAPWVWHQPVGCAARCPVPVRLLWCPTWSAGLPAGASALVQRLVVWTLDALQEVVGGSADVHITFADGAPFTDISAFLGAQSRRNAETLLYAGRESELLWMFGAPLFEDGLYEEMVEDGRFQRVLLFGALDEDDARWYADVRRAVLAAEAARRPDAGALLGRDDEAEPLHVPLLTGADAPPPGEGTFGAVWSALPFAQAEVGWMVAEEVEDALGEDRASASPASLWVHLGALGVGVALGALLVSASRALRR